MARNAGDVADTVRGQLSYCTHLLNAYSECAFSAPENEIESTLTEVHNRLLKAADNVGLMLDAYEQQKTVRNTTRNLEKKRGIT